MCYERTENRGTGRHLSVIIQVYLDFSCQLPNKNKCYLLEEHKNKIEHFLRSDQDAGPMHWMAEYLQEEFATSKQFSLSFLVPISRHYFLFFCAYRSYWTVQHWTELLSELSTPSVPHEYTLHWDTSKVLPVQTTWDTSIVALLSPLPFYAGCTFEGWDHQGASKVLSAYSARSLPCHVCHIQTRACEGCRRKKLQFSDLLVISDSCAGCTLARGSPEHWVFMTCISLFHKDMILFQYAHSPL